MQDSLTNREYNFGEILYIMNPKWMSENYYIVATNKSTYEKITFPPIRFGDGCIVCDILGKYAGKNWNYTLRNI